MKLPEDISMKNTAHGHGAKGMAFYSYEDTAGLGVLVDARRAHGRAPFIETWRWRWLPGQHFGGYQELRAAAAELSDEQVAAERAKWPQLLKPPRERIGGSATGCWLHQDRPATHNGTVQDSWLESDCTMALLCAECAAAAASDPQVIVRASVQRAADVAARPMPRLGLLP